ncbi:MAG: hypothetical protein ACM30E_02695, partial [Nitrososphaerales archaeon]
VMASSTVPPTYFPPNGSTTRVINPTEPVLPLLSYNDNATGYVMRGVGFRGGTYTEIPGITPFTGAATTEIRGIHTPFVSNVYYPIVPWDTNYFDALAKTVETGATRLNVTPVQYRSDSPTSTTGTVRKFDSMSFKLFYSANTEAYPNTTAGITNIPALSSPPVIARVFSTGSSGQVSFSVNVTGDPSAGIQAVWVTYTSSQAPFAGQWQSLDLVQDPNDSTLWTGTLPLQGSDPANFRFMVQAANGVGLISLNTNRGAYFMPDVDPGLPSTPPGATVPTPAAAPTALQIVSGPGSGKYGTSASFTVRLTSNNSPLANQPVVLGLTTQQQTAVTDENGQATINLTLIGTPGPDTFRATFVGTPDYNPAFASVPFAVLPTGTTLTVKTTTPVYSATNGGADLAVALADETGRPLPQKGVLVLIKDSSGNVVNAQPVITDLYGNAVLKTAPLTGGSYAALTYFGQVVVVGDQSIDLTNPRYGPSSASTSFIANTPPTPKAGGPYSVLEGGSATLTATATDPNAGQTLRYFWDLDGNGSYETAGQSVTFYAAANGPSNLTVGLQVCDPVDCATTQVVVTVLPGYLRYCIYSRGLLSIDRYGVFTTCAMGAEGDITVAASNSVGGLVDARAGSVVVNGGATVSGRLTASGNVTLQQSSTAGATVQAGGTVTLQAQALVSGDLLASQGVSIAPSARVLGTINGSAPAPVFPPVTPLALSFPAGTQNITVARTSSTALPPGNYGNLVLNTGTSLTLTAGRYSFQSIWLQKSAKLVLDLGNVATNSVIVSVVGQAVFDTGTSVQVTRGLASQVLFWIQGNQVQMAQSGTFAGTYIAPNARFWVNRSVSITGALYGLAMNVDQSVKVTGQPATEPLRSLLAAGSLGR